MNAHVNAKLSIIGCWLRCTVLVGAACGMLLALSLPERAWAAADPDQAEQVVEMLFPTDLLRRSFRHDTNYEEFGDLLTPEQWQCVEDSSVVGKQKLMIDRFLRGPGWSDQWARFLSSRGGRAYGEGLHRFEESRLRDEAFDLDAYIDTLSRSRQRQIHAFMATDAGRAWLNPANEEDAANVRELANRSMDRCRATPTPPAAQSFPDAIDARKLEQLPKLFAPLEVVGNSPAADFRDMQELMPAQRTSVVEAGYAKIVVPVMQHDIGRFFESDDLLDQRQPFAETDAGKALFEMMRRDGDPMRSSLRTQRLERRDARYFKEVTRFFDSPAGQVFDKPAPKLAAPQPQVSRLLVEVERECGVSL